MNDNLNVTAAGEDRTALSDVELAGRATSDPEAFGELYARYRQQVYRTVYARLRHRESAEDVVSEVFVKALRAIGGYRPSAAPFWAWLHRIAVNAAVDHLRAQRPTDDLSGLDQQAARGPAVEESALQRIEADQVWSAVGQLCAAQRTAVTLRLGEDLPLARIAGEMCRSEGAVKQLLNRGIASVRTQLLVTRGAA